MLIGHSHLRVHFSWYYPFMLIVLLTRTCGGRYKEDLIHKWAGWVVTTGGDGLGSIAQVDTHWRTADPT
jgi:hypothetical protein